MRTEELLALGVFGRQSRLGQRVSMLLERERKFSPQASRVRVAASTAALLACAILGAFAPRIVAFADAPRFEVTSVKPNKSMPRGIRFDFPAGGRYVATNVTLQNLTVNAYLIFDFQVEGAPGWANSDHFDVEGKAQGNPSRQQVRLMVRSLLADRFKLATHRETKEMPVYEIVVAKGGIKFKEGKCAGEPGPANPCGGTTVSLRGEAIARELSVKDFGDALSSLLSRTVVDKTGLSGKYDFDLHWTPDGSAIHGPGDPDAPPSDPNGPSIFTALREQLGLELKAARGPVEMLVIDHAEKPEPN